MEGGGCKWYSYMTSIQGASPSSSSHDNARLCSASITRSPNLLSVVLCPAYDEFEKPSEDCPLRSKPIISPKSPSTDEKISITRILTNLLSVSNSSQLCKNLVLLTN